MIHSSHHLLFKSVNIVSATQSLMVLYIIGIEYCKYLRSLSSSSSPLILIGTESSTGRSVNGCQSSDLILIAIMMIMIALTMTIMLVYIVKCILYVGL